MKTEKEMKEAIPEASKRKHGLLTSRTIRCALFQITIVYKRKLGLSYSE